MILNDYVKNVLIVKKNERLSYSIPYSYWMYQMRAEKIYAKQPFKAKKFKVYTHKIFNLNLD